MLCPPLVHVGVVAEALGQSPVALGAQNLARWTDDGAYTGEVSGAMLADMGCRYVLVGHSERRALLGDQLRERLQLQALALLRLQQLLLELRRQALFHLPDLILYPGHDGTNRGLPALRYHARRSVPNVLTRALVSPE